MLREILDHVSAPAQGLEEVLQTPCIAMVPLLKERTQSLREKLLNLRGGNRGKENDHKLASFEAVVNEPLSRFTEAIRSVKLAVDLQLSIKQARLLVLHPRFQ